MDSSKLTVTQVSRDVFYETGLFILINSNKRQDDPTIGDFIKSTIGVCHAMHNLIQWVPSGSRGKERVTHRYDHNIDGPIEVKFTFEVGAETGYLHCHIHVKSSIKQDSYTFFDLNSCRGFYRQRLGYCPCIKVKRTKETNRLQRYMMKDPVFV